MRTVTVLALMLCADVFGAAGKYVEEVTGVSGGPLAVHCRYARGFVKYKHYWCTGTDWLSCSIILQSTGSEEEVTKGRFTIKDIHKARIFTVTITGLKEEDSGLYWCGTERVGTDTMYQVKVTVSKSDPGFYQTEKASTTAKGLPVTAPVSPDTPPGPQSNAPEETVSARAHVTPSDPPSAATAGDTEAPSAPERLPQSLLPAAILGMLLLTAVTSWLILRNRKKSLEGEGAPRDPGIELVNPPQVNMLENRLYASAEEPEATDQATVYFLIEHVPHSAPPDTHYQEIQTLYSEVTAPACSSVRRQPGFELCSRDEDEHCSTVMVQCEGQDVLYDNVNE